MCHICGQSDPRLAVLMLNVDARALPVNTGAWEGSVAHSGMSSITGSTRLPQLCHWPPITDRWPH